VQAYSDGYLADEPVEAHNLLSNRCKQRISWSSFTRLSVAADQLHCGPRPIQTFTANIQDNLARATYTYNVPAINQTQEPCVREHGQWHEDDC
jgi:hypothetical protein